MGEEAIVAGPRPFFYWIDVAASRAIKVPRVFSAGSNNEVRRGNKKRERGKKKEERREDWG